MEKITIKSRCSENRSPARRVNGITKEVQNGLLFWENHITIINLNNQDINFLNENVIFPPNIKELDLSHNRLKAVPNVVLKLTTLKVLDISYNQIVYFNDVPKFCQTIENLNLSNNFLKEPPYWVWSEVRPHLSKLNLSNNFHMNLLSINNLISQFTSLVTHLSIYNCNISQYKAIFGSFIAVKVLEIGASEPSGFSNRFEEIPSVGLEKCCDLEELTASNTNVYNIKANICIYKSLRVLNLSENNIYGLPDEFCNLENLEECILSHNNIIYLPEKITKLKRLKKLAIDSNELCMLPKAISDLKDLTTLDLYNNKLYDVTVEIKNLKEIDLAQNYFDELTDEDYLEKRERLRLHHDGRFDGRKADTINNSDHENTSPSINEDSSDEKELQTVDNKVESEEDWDSDSYWEPNDSLDYFTPPPSPWICYVKKRIAEGHFCPIDMHVVSVTDQVEYEKLCNPPIVHESEGEFDDLVDSDS